MKTLTLVPYGGLSNRILAITSAIGFCKDHDMMLKVFWFKDWGMGAAFHQLFELSPDVGHVEVIDAKWYDYRCARPRKIYLGLPNLWQWVAFEKRIYQYEYSRIPDDVSSYNSVYLVSCYQFHEWSGMFRSLQPLKTIQMRIRHEIESMIGCESIGFHIRRGDSQLSLRHSPLSLFIDKMQEEQAMNAQIKFYVASDSKEEKLKLKELFGDSIITSFKEVRRDTADGIIDALIELYVLSSTKKIYGSFYSTYSTLAAKLTNIPIEVLSIN